MGANNSTRRVSFESDENENVSVVKGIRVSDSIHYITWLVLTKQVLLDCLKAIPVNTMM